ncbi:hypothetical protein A8L59_18565 [Pseudomonas koreensis]|uniref:Uncharacterized protein n=1 Tax=Pseudomonas koreensis TaxID=198620 RepID=A0AAC9BUP2_9PSED|nr:hypothetical protein A8L59_18565 [Pseudomonas koreensis]
MLWLAERTDFFYTQRFELVVGYRYDDTIISILRWLSHRRNSILMLSFCTVRPRIKYIDFDIMLFQLSNNIYDTSVAKIRAIFFKCEPHDQNTCAINVNPALQHSFYQLRYYIGPHSIIQATASKDDFRVITYGLSLMRQIVRINTYTMPPYQTWTERQEVPLRAGSLQYRLGIDSHLVKNDCQLINQRDIDVPLCVFNDFCCFSDLNTTSFMSTRCDDFVIQIINKISHFRCRTRRYLFDSGNTVFFVTRINPLRTVTGKKVHIEFQSGDLLKDWYTVLFRCTRIYSGLINDDIAFFQNLTDRFGSFNQRREIGLLVLIDRRWNRYDEYIAAYKCVQVMTKTKVLGLFKLFVINFQR